MSRFRHLRWVGLSVAELAGTRRVHPSEKRRMLGDHRATNERRCRSTFVPFEALAYPAVRALQQPPKE